MCAIAGCSPQALRFTLDAESLETMRRSLPVLLVLLSLAAVAPAQYGVASQSGVELHGRSYSDLYAAQRILLSNYCRLDFEGGRLQPGGWSHFRPYTSLPDNPDFSRVVVVTRFDIEIPDQPSELLNVNYQAVGYYEIGEGYTATTASDRVEFRAREQNNALIITDIGTEAPHVSPKAAIAWMHLQLNDPKTSDFEREHLKDALVQLNRFVPQARTASKTPGK